ncbi:equilibrative nucleobase transporter 1 isoform X3 [Hydra vulgaris]|uniref:Equilibrative nucleobase transporter 1 isoform X3 n=1 Tax=Hydra vulgaris TaxID=6087 RepID=A0ABM4CJY8_HYDVU
MAILSESDFKKPFVLILFLIACCLENFIVGAPVYGYSSMLEIFKASKFFHHLCGITNTTLTTRNNFEKTCEKQDLALNWVFISGMFFHSILKFPIGYCVDRFGPQLCQYVGCFFLALFGVCLGLASPGIEILLYLAFVFLAVASSTLMLNVYKVVNVMCWKWKSVGICMISGAVDSSSAIFFIFLTVFELGVTVQTISIGYTVSTMVFVIFVTILFYPNNEYLVLLMKQDQVDCQPEKTAISTKRYCEDSKFISTCSSMYHEKDTLLHKKNNFDNRSLKDCLFSWINFLSVMSFSLLLLKLLYFVVLKYLKYFGYIQFMGVLFAPISILILRKSEPSLTLTERKSLHWKYIQRVRSCIAPSVILTSVVLILDGLQLIQNLKLTIPLFILYLFGLNLQFCYGSMFVSLAFPAKHFCSIYGFMTLTAGFILMIQHPLLSLEETVFSGNQFMVNVILFFLSLLTFSLPIYLWCHCNKLLKQYNMDEKTFLNKPLRF